LRPSPLPAPNVLKDGELHRVLVAHRNLVQTRTIEIGEVRHQTRAEIRSHNVQRASEAKWPLTDVAECELGGTRRRERAHDQNFLAGAGSKTQAVQRNRGPIGAVICSTGS